MGCICDKVDVEADGHQYKIVKQIATGGFSQIMLVEDVRTSQKFAMKRISCHSDEEIDRTKMEIDVHRRFGSHPNIMSLVGSAYEEGVNGWRFMLIFPYYKQGSLAESLTQRRPTRKFLEQDLVLSYFKQIVSAVRVLHEAKIIHRDIKPGNVLLAEEDQVILMDFGSCTNSPIRIDNERKSRRIVDDAAEHCSMPYRAPELFTCLTGTAITEKVDIWSLGCLLYALCYFRSPFDDIYERGDSIALAAQSGRITFEDDAPYDSSIKDLIKDLLSVNPTDRPSTAQIEDRLGCSGG
ncbi:hypothetical protein QR680_015118 [Steinernema hermaphroditum]|uniref:Protein kinase domain-containing protein n=1 Tax=Steinernema hermaphroditum TaxID=289476 RepID=A0AA39M4D4_9BILA|nr:hypothetical protein QR680_015118 [Steinernema hermaphroditum]